LHRNSGMREGPLGRLKQLEREVRSRLARVCRHFPRVEFDRLVRHVAMTKLRFELPAESFAELEQAVAGRDAGELDLR
jgi:hypothetical protein